MRAVLLKVAGGERIPPEFVRAVLAGCLKVGALNATVFTMPSKSRGLRIQTSDIILGEPGVRKRDIRCYGNLGIQLTLIPMCFINLCVLWCAIDI